MVTTFCIIYKSAMPYVHSDGRQRCRCAVLAHLNPHVPHVPGFLITFVLKVSLDPCDFVTLTSTPVLDPHRVNTLALQAEHLS
jgi:hypothetical protein